MAVFKDRYDAGQALAERLKQYTRRTDVIVLALPRGGVPVGYAVVEDLGVPLDFILVRKLGVPGHEELAMGAIASNGVRVLNEQVVQALKIPPAIIEQVTVEEQRELERRERAYRGDRPPLDVHDKTVILTDDGLATGSTMHAAVQALREKNPARIVVAVPTAPPDVCEEFRRKVDEMICAITPEPFYGVGLWYNNFEQISDAEVRDLLQRAAERHLQADGVSNGGRN